MLLTEKQVPRNGNSSTHRLKMAHQKVNQKIYKGIYVPVFVRARCENSLSNYSIGVGAGWERGKWNTVFIQLCWLSFIMKTSTRWGTSSIILGHERNLTILHMPRCLELDWWCLPGSGLFPLTWNLVWIAMHCLLSHSENLCAPAWTLSGAPVLFQCWGEDGGKRKCR